MIEGARASSLLTTCNSAQTLANTVRSRGSASLWLAHYLQQPAVHAVGSVLPIRIDDSNRQIAIITIDESEHLYYNKQAFTCNITGERPCQQTLTIQRAAATVMKAIDHPIPGTSHDLAPLYQRASRQSKHAAIRSSGQQYDTTRPGIRLGFAIRTVSQPSLISGSPPHLSILLTHLGDALRYLERTDIRFYRFALPRHFNLSDLAECQTQLALLNQHISTRNLRLGVHLDPHLSLSHSDEQVADATIRTIEATCQLLAALDHPQTINHTLVMHPGAADPAAQQRFTQRWVKLSIQARRRTTIEHTGAGFSLGQLLVLAARTGIPIVFDYLHYRLHNPERLSLALALGLTLATWPRQIRPEVHLSSQRSEAHLLPGRNGTSRVIPPRAGQHADFVVAHDAIALLEAGRGLPPFDLMIEAKAGDLALLRLRQELAHYAPEWAARLA